MKSLLLALVLFQQLYPYCLFFAVRPSWTPRWVWVSCNGTSQSCIFQLQIFAYFLPERLWDQSLLWARQKLSRLYKCSVWMLGGMNLSACSLCCRHTVLKSLLCFLRVYFLVCESQVVTKPTIVKDENQLGIWNAQCIYCEFPVYYAICVLVFKCYTDKIMLYFPCHMAQVEKLRPKFFKWLVKG